MRKRHLDNILTFYKEIIICWENSKGGQKEAEERG